MAYNPKGKEVQLFNLPAETRHQLAQGRLEAKHSLTPKQRVVVAMPTGEARQLRLREIRQGKFVWLPDRPVLSLPELGPPSAA
jgi:hypothetical protein